MEGLTVDAIVNYGAIGLIAVFLAKTVQKLYEDMKQQNESNIISSTKREDELMDFVTNMTKTQERMIQTQNDIKNTLEELTITQRDILNALEDINKRLCDVERGRINGQDEG